MGTILLGVAESPLCENMKVEVDNLKVMDRSPYLHPRPFSTLHATLQNSYNGTCSFKMNGVDQHVAGNLLTKFQVRDEESQDSSFYLTFHEFGRVRDFRPS
ncbi:predicted protein [Lichtheimia corymbifera JMRC:FSU:9682]|uniref:Uncharacterized protein n=1 Tax=Lichtheimia corymbifera JMRC:FSU:9682 TaxID=1263082 RepID=A0A068S1J6_9FUNG|nr:predicted protein [Lichtheimia corymbifera JMRC:FSU:9682]